MLIYYAIAFMENDECNTIHDDIADGNGSPQDDDLSAAGADEKEAGAPSRGELIDELLALHRLTFDSFDPWFRDFLPNEEMQLRDWIATLSDEQLTYAVGRKRLDAQRQAQEAAARWPYPQCGVARP